MTVKNRPDVVSVTINGCTQDNWEHYEIDSDLMTPADAWSVTLSQPEISLPPPVVVGAGVWVKMNGETVLQGILDEREIEVSKGHHSLSLSGRDGAGILLDCSSEILSSQFINLERVVNQIVKPLGIVRVRIDAEKTMTHEKVATEPGETAWDSLRRVAEANGLWPWFEPDGTLVVGGPRYDVPPVAHLNLNSDGKANNILSLKEHTSIMERFSQVSVYGQRGAMLGVDDDQGFRNNIRAVVKDKSLSSYRPKVLIDNEAVNEGIAIARAEKFLSDSRIKSNSLIATVSGHRTDRGVLWNPGQRIGLKSDVLGIDSVYFLMARRFSGDKVNGQRTRLTLKEDQAWLLSAHPSKLKHGRRTGFKR